MTRPAQLAKLDKYKTLVYNPYMEMKQCNKCGAIKPLGEFAKRDKGKYRPTCKECHNAYQREYWQRAGTWEKQKDRITQYKRDNKAKLAALKYGISEEQYIEGMSGLCQLCGNRPAEAVDHCHATGLFRGFLCGLCNRGIGMLGDTLDSVRKAVVYLESREHGPLSPHSYKVSKG